MSRLRLRSVLLSLAALCGLSCMLSGCTDPVVVDAAPHAADPACAEVMLRMPQTLTGAEERTTSSQATEAWGSPAIAILRCGVTPPQPTTDTCVSVNGVDWISVPTKSSMWRFVSYGRTPAVEVLVDREKIPGATVLAEVSKPVSALPQHNQCLSAEDITSTAPPTGEALPKG